MAAPTAPVAAETAPAAQEAADDKEARRQAWIQFYLESGETEKARPVPVPSALPPCS